MVSTQKFLNIFHQLKKSDFLKKSEIESLSEMLKDLCVLTNALMKIGK